MRRNLTLTLLFITLLTHANQWKLVWSDEFNYQGQPDSTKWGHEIGSNYNNELQFYTYQRLNNACVKDGNLLIIARRENYKGAKYTSARISTYNKFHIQYGKIEARIKIQSRKGIWPAFWMLGQNFYTVGSPKCGEIDIMEHINREKKIHTAMHWDRNGLVSFENAIKCNVKKYHNYSIEWDESSIKWFLDGKKYFEGKINRSKNNSDEFHQPFYIILNIAVGGNWPGKPYFFSHFPDTMMVDYVRVFKKTQK
jgi:Beta-glucanase/Beta-glucan synthetase